MKITIVLAVLAAYPIYTTWKSNDENTNRSAEAIVTARYGKGNYIKDPSCSFGFIIRKADNSVIRLVLTQNGGEREEKLIPASN